MSNDERSRILHRVQPLRAQLEQSLRGSLADHERLMRALHPLADPPAGDGWNRSELIDLLPPGPPVEAAVLAGIVPRASGAQVILTRRTETLRTHGGQVGFPGGRTEPDDRDALAAALRESQEEIALAPGQVQALGYLDPFVTITGYRVTPVVAVVDPDFLMAADNLRQVEINHRGRIRHVLEYSWPGQRIWGATAAILYNLRRRLEQVQ